MPSCHCVATDRHFTPARAQTELAQYQQRGPSGTARLILKSLSDLATTPRTLPYASDALQRSRGRGTISALGRL